MGELSLPFRFDSSSPLGLNQEPSTLQDDYLLSRSPLSPGINEIQPPDLFLSSRHSLEPSSSAIVPINTNV